jgi:hypothetical protein
MINSIPSDVCSILIRDNFDILSKEEQIFCKNIIIEYALIPINSNYKFTVSD